MVTTEYTSAPGMLLATVPAASMVGGAAFCTSMLRASPILAVSWFHACCTPGGKNWNRWEISSILVLTSASSAV